VKIIFHKSCAHSPDKLAHAHLPVLASGLFSPDLLPPSTSPPPLDPGWQRTNICGVVVCRRGAWKFH
jgi:hypothetical protein